MGLGAEGGVTASEHVIRAKPEPTAEHAPTWKLTIDESKVSVLTHHDRMRGLALKHFRAGLSAIEAGAVTSGDAAQDEAAKVELSCLIDWLERLP